MPVLQLKTRDQVLGNMAAKVVARTDLTDLTDASSIKLELAAVAHEIDGAYFQFTRLQALMDLRQAAGDDLDARAKEIAPGTIRRRGPRKAIGKVVFSRATNTGQTLLIAAGTVVRTSTNQSYITTEAATIAAASPQQITGHGVGRDSNPVAAVALVAGESGNVSAGAVIAFQSKPPGLSEVINVTGFTQGRETENDDDFRARIFAYIQALARSTVQALEFAAIDVEDSTGKRVISSRVFEDPVDRANVILYIDDGVGTAQTLGSAIVNEPLLNPALGGEEFARFASFPYSLDAGVSVSLQRGGPTTVLTNGVDYFLNPASGLIYIPVPTLGGVQAGDIVRASYTPFTGLIPAVQKVIDGDRNDRANFPGWRAAGVLVRVLSAQVISPLVQGEISVLDGFDRDTVLAEATDATLEYINTLEISGDVVRNEIIERVMEVPGVYDLNLISIAANFVILDHQIARATAANVMFT